MILLLVNIILNYFVACKGEENTEFDQVLAQYTHLPFPSVPEEQMRIEKLYYGGNMKWEDHMCKLSSCGAEAVGVGDCLCPQIFSKHAQMNLDNINKALFEGKQTFKKDFRVMVAGGGTGMATMYLAEQLNQTKSEVVYVDLSPKSMAIATRRAEYRSLKNIRFFNNKIENIPSLNLGKFDFFECTGVLHHLEDPLKGLRVLAESLKDGGGAHIFVYSTHSRKWIYLMQDLMRLMKDSTDGIFDEIKNTKLMLEMLKEVPFGKVSETPYWSTSESDEQLYDLLLHKRDVSFTLQEILELVKKSGLHFVDFSKPQQKKKIEAFLQHSHLQDDINKDLFARGSKAEREEFRTLLHSLAREERLAVADLSIRIPQHQLYLSNTRKEEL